MNSQLYGLLSLLLLFNISCNEEEWLREKPIDFFSPENTYVNYDDFQSAMADLYARVRDIHFGAYDHVRYAHFYGTDLYFNARGDNNRLGDYELFLRPTHSWMSWHWNNWYKVISNANTIISRLEETDQLTDGQKTLIAAEAKFFRAFSYRYLVYLYGGVPLILEEVTAPRTDYIRTSHEAVLNQIAKDASEAAANLPHIDEVSDGKVSNLVAQQLLAETYISLEDYDSAIIAASVVIDDPNTALMTGRFGTRANEDPYDEFLKFPGPGDVYWDLFRPGNQNRSAGNTEALWVAQMGVNIIGGLLNTSDYNNALERIAAPVHYSTFQDPDGNEGMIRNPRSNYNSGGRGISNLMNTDFFLYTLWENNWENDIRNAPHNIIRDVKYDNPKSAWYDSSAVKYPSPTRINQSWRWYPYPSKITTPGDHPVDLILDVSLGTLSSNAGSTYRNMYYMRLAETYLLRAEAYLGKGDLTNAAADINTVRERSNAYPVKEGDVDIDYILDERGRELIYEEQRRITLHRTGKLVERVRAHNPLNPGSVLDHHGLWPIPFSTIEANKDAVIEQNPGYN